MALTLDGTNGIVSSGSITTQSSSGVIFSDSSALTAASSPYVLKNRIINGAMVIDQRNAGASVTPTSAQYGLDRWKMSAPVASKYSFQQNAGSVTPPVGFANYLGITSLSAYSVASTDVFTAYQYIEGYNIADLGWGTANAKTVTLSFWVRSSLTGTFGGCLGNGNATRSYPFTYTISSANTWEYKTITIAGDTTGTWNTTNSVGLALYLGFGVGSTYSGTAGSWSSTEYYSATGATSVVGTNGATFYITGVQLEIGSTATPFERRLYGTEIGLCQRYYWKSTPSTYNAIGAGHVYSTTTAEIYIKHPVNMRASPTYSYSGTLYIAQGSSSPAATAIAASYGGLDSGRADITSSGLTMGRGVMVITENGSSNFFQATAEL